MKIKIENGEGRYNEDEKFMDEMEENGKVIFR
ncbi:MAG: hypothetical protein FYV88_3400, partial [Bacteroidetes bacterium]|nr:hypothetical protein [Bacteroidota bacterium]